MFILDYLFGPEPINKNYINQKTPWIREVASNPTRFAADRHGRLVEISKEAFLALDLASKEAALRDVEELLAKAQVFQCDECVNDIKKLRNKIFHHLHPDNSIENLPGDVHRILIGRELPTPSLANLAQTSKPLHKIYQPQVWEKLKEEITIGPKE